MKMLFYLTAELFYYLLSALSRRRREVIHVIFACAIPTFIKPISVKQ